MNNELKVKEYLSAILSLVLQFSFREIINGEEFLTHGFLSALEDAFEILEEQGCIVDKQNRIRLQDLLNFSKELETK